MIRNTYPLHQRKPLLKPWRFRDNNRIRAFPRIARMPYVAGLLARHPTVPSHPPLRFQLDTQRRRFRVLHEVMLLVQLRRRSYLKDTLVAYFHTRTPSTLHILITQDIKMTYSISLLFCNSFYYYFQYAMNSPFRNLSLIKTPEELNF